MTFGDAITLGLISVPAAALLGRALVYFCQELPDRREEQAATTPEQKEAIVLERKAQHYREAGHPDPWQAASDEIGGTIEVARFRAYACDEYVRSGRSLDECRKEWWRSAAKRILSTQSVGRSKAEATAYLKAVEAVIFGAMPDTVYAEGEAAEKWQAELKRVADWNASHERKRDPISEAVMAGHWEN